MDQISENSTDKESILSAILDLWLKEGSIFWEWRENFKKIEDFKEADLKLFIQYLKREKLNVHSLKSPVPLTEQELEIILKYRENIKPGYFNYLYVLYGYDWSISVCQPMLNYEDSQHIDNAISEVNRYRKVVVYKLWASEPWDTIKEDERVVFNVKALNLLNPENKQD